MTLIELFAPKGALNDDEQKSVGERLVTELMSSPRAPAEVIERTRGLTWVMVHEPALWTVSGRAIASGEPARFLVRVTVSAGHLTDGMRAEMIKRLTRVLAEHVPDPQRLYQRPDAWIQIVELPDGNAGTFGRVVRTADLMRLVMTGALPETAEATAPDPHASAVDPICGMTVERSPSAIALEHEGMRHLFCSEGCRKLFAAQVAARVP